MLVQGDTTTVMAAALLPSTTTSALGMWKPGCAPTTSGSPFPKRSTGGWPGLSPTCTLPPPSTAAENLLREGVPDWRIAVTGNPVIDALNQIVRRPAPPL